MRCILQYNMAYKICIFCCNKTNRIAVSRLAKVDVYTGVRTGAIYSPNERYNDMKYWPHPYHNSVVYGPCCKSNKIEYTYVFINCHHFNLPPRIFSNALAHNASSLPHSEQTHTHAEELQSKRAKRIHEALFSEMLLNTQQLYLIPHIFFLFPLYHKYSANIPCTLLSLSKTTFAISSTRIDKANGGKVVLLYHERRAW